MEAGEEGTDELVDASREEQSCVMAALLTLELKRLIRPRDGESRACPDAHLLPEHERKVEW